MVVNIFVYIEGCEDIEGVAEVDFPWNGCIPLEDWEEVRSMDDGINMNNRHNPVMVAVEIRFNYPHAVVGIGVVEGFAKLVDEGT